MINFILILAVALIVPGAAHAGPIGVAITAFSTWAASSAVAGFVARMVIYAGLSALGAALRGGQTQRQPGIKTEITTSGGTNPATFILGRYATAGNRVAPPYSGPNRGDLPNKFLTFVADISDLPITSLERVAINDEWIADLTFDADGLHQKRGMFEDGRVILGMEMAAKSLLGFTFYDGRQTQADPWMLDQHGDDPDRPWQADMVGTGVSYAVLTFTYNRERFNGLPRFLFEVRGIALYDPRRDTSVGGSGAQRWGNPATWAFSENPAVMIYNILRGIALPDGSVWGGRVAAADLPLANWFAAMNECDATRTRRDGVAVAQYVAGFEVSVDTPPATVIDALKNACAGEIVEVGGVYTMRVGPVALPVFFFTDDDLSVDDPRSLSPHSGLEAAHNALHVKHPSPDALWLPHDAPPRYDAAAEAEDGRRLTASLDLPAVARDEQVQRLMGLWLKDERRMRRHDLTLPPEAAALDPLDAVAWTSARNGYTSKVFEVGDIADDFTTLNQTISLRERDANDVNWLPSRDELAVSYPSVAVRVPPVRVLQGWGLEPTVLRDAEGGARRAGLRMVWDGDNLGDAREILVQIRVLGAVDLAITVSITGIMSGAARVFEGILHDTDYQARAFLVSDREAAWTAWADARTSDVRFSNKDLADELLAEIAAAGAMADAAQDEIAAAVADIDAEFDAVRDEAALIRGDVLSITSRVGSAEGAITSEAGARAAADSALASTLNTVAAEIDTAQAAISAEQVTRANADSALSGSFNTLSARLTNEYLPKASIQSNYKSAVDTEIAIASARTALQASINGVSGEVDDVAAVTATLDGKVRAFRGIAATTSGGQIAAIRLTSYSNPDGTGASTIQFDADNVIAARTMSANRLIAKTITAGSGVIGDLAVDTLQIKDNAVTVQAVGVRSTPVTIGTSWADITSVNLDCINGLNTLLDVYVSTGDQSGGNTGWNELLLRVLHEGSNFRYFSMPVDSTQYFGDTAAERYHDVKAAFGSWSLIKFRPGNGVKSFQVQARTTGRSHAVIDAIVAAQQVKK